MLLTPRCASPWRSVWARASLSLALDSSLEPRADSVMWSTAQRAAGAPSEGGGVSVGAEKLPKPLRTGRGRGCCRGP